MGKETKKSAAQLVIGSDAWKEAQAREAVEEARRKLERDAKLEEEKQAAARAAAEEERKRLEEAIPRQTDELPSVKRKM